MNQSICGDVASIKIGIWVLEEEERNSMKVNILNVFTRLLVSKCLHIYQSECQFDWEFSKTVHHHNVACLVHEIFLNFW